MLNRNLLKCTCTYYSVNVFHSLRWFIYYIYVSMATNTAVSLNLCLMTSRAAA
ncbi:hypothetical protein M434DRAFT_401919 [Hypoxylon sp. CO27-5]|nr:hypothetical protein M434DRAFT_401919 [Hypoxylon sp. CO27-5]